MGFKTFDNGICLVNMVIHNSGVVGAHLLEEATISGRDVEAKYLDYAFWPDGAIVCAGVLVPSLFVRPGKQNRIRR